MMLNFKKNQEKDQEPAQPPFWVDGAEVDMYGRSPVAFQSFTKLVKIQGILSIAIVAFGSLCGVIAFLWELLGPVAALAFIAFMLMGLANGLIRWRQTLALEKQKKQVQTLARQTTGAEMISSAIHVAGHPRFEREQPVVLALKGDELSIHTYQSSVPVDVIRISDIQALHTVVYDDERVPHIDVIDSNAQALQVTIATGGKEYTCLFRRLRNVRAIDWFHAIQKAKAISSG